MLRHCGRARLLAGGEAEQRSSLSRSTTQGLVTVDAPITGPLGLTLLWRERPRRQYGNRPSGKLCPLKRARLGGEGGCDAEDMQSE